MLKSSKLNHSSKRKAKNSMAKTKKNNFRESQKTKNVKMTNAESIQQNHKSLHSEDICVSPTDHQLHSQCESSEEIKTNNAFVQKHADITLMQNKNSISEINNSISEIRNSNILLSPFHDSYFETPEFSMKRNPYDLFNSIYTGKFILTLPNRSWSMHFTEKPIRCIVASEINVHNDSGIGFVPLYTKQIVFYEKMNYDIFLFNSKASEKNLPATLESIADVMNVIIHTDDLKLCSGGPDVNLYNNVNLECAYRDNREKWRHNLCSLEVSKGDTCELCLSLEDILKRHVQRNKQFSRTKGISGSGKRKRTSQ